MTFKWRPVASKVAALSILLLIVAAGWSLVLSPTQNALADLDLRIEQQRRLLGGLLNAASATRTADNWAVALAGLDRERLFREGETDGSKTAGMQGDLVRHARAQGLQLERLRIMPAVDEPAMRLLGVETHTTATLEQLVRFLQAIEAARPVFIVKELLIAPAPENRERARQHRVKIVVYGASKRAGNGGDGDD